MTIVALTVSAVSAQSFDAASVRQYAHHSSSEDPSAPDVIDLYRPGGGTELDYVHVTMRNLLAAAYGVGKDQVVGPAWVGTRYYDISAVIPRNTLSYQIPVMLQNLITQRFGMIVSKKQAPRKGFVLLPLNGGPKLALTQVGSQPGFEKGSGYLRFTDCSPGELTRLLSAFIGRPVADQTGASGNYDIVLKVFGTELRMAGAVGGNWLHSVNEALGELGLKLEAREVAGTNIVVEKANPVPTED